jgi:uncharacterized membrane protein
VTFFDYRSLYRELDWMLPPRGPDVSPQLQWYPAVTLVQLKRRDSAGMLARALVNR